MVVKSLQIITVVILISIKCQRLDNGTKLDSQKSKRTATSIQEHSNYLFCILDAA